MKLLHTTSLLIVLTVSLVLTCSLVIHAQHWDDGTDKGAISNYVKIKWEDMRTSKVTVRPVTVSDGSLAFAYCSLSRSGGWIWYVIRSCGSGSGVQLEYTYYDAVDCTGTASSKVYVGCGSDYSGAIGSVFYKISMMSQAE
jgi:hypothetical protein